MKDEASYTCDTCGEEIVVPIDPSAGTSQEYVEDCPVCCRPNVVHVEVEEARAPLTFRAAARSLPRAGG